MISKLTNAPVLQPLSVNKDFVTQNRYYTDSSHHGIGYGVFQPADEDPHLLRVIGYGGQALDPSYRTWSVLQIELYAVYLALRNYETYCRHRTVHNFSENITLVYLKGMSLGSPREKRMASFIIGFQLKFHHVKGQQN